VSVCAYVWASLIVLCFAKKKRFGVLHPATCICFSLVGYDVPMSSYMVLPQFRLASFINLVQNQNYNVWPNINIHRRNKYIMKLYFPVTLGAVLTSYHKCLCFDLLPLVHFMLCIIFRASQTVQTLTKNIDNNTNICHVKCM
jgi:hypothetical protein